jgi:hypothetical protein
VNNLYPATPLTGTGVGSLVGVADYIRITGDSNGDQDTLDEATNQASQFCNRTLGYGQYVERLYVNRRGMAYPSATPLDPNYQPSPATALVQGPAVWVGYFTPLPSLPVWTGVVLPQTDITYAGGYQPYGVTTGPTPQLPAALMRAICKIAYFTLNPAVLPNLPAGATSVSLQGVTMAGNLSPFAFADDDTMRTLRRYTRREIPAFGN